MGYPSGAYFMCDEKNTILISGSMEKKAKNGTWRFYHYDTNVFSSQEFADNVGGVEKYYLINTLNNFSGKLIQKYNNGTVKSEFKISEGLREGKSKYFSENGQLLRVEKYKQGILITK